MKKHKRPNLLVLGASGSVARAFLRRLGGRRAHFGKLVLADKNRKVLNDPCLEHDRLRYTFVQQRLALPGNQKQYKELLKRHHTDIVLDLTDFDTLPVLKATDDLGVSYVNTCLADHELDVASLVQTIHPDRDLATKAPHILCTGMNPGAVNMWVRHGIEHFGVPKQVIHWEYDTSTPAEGWQPVITWSKKEFLTEAVWNPTGFARGKETVMMKGCALQNLHDMEPILAPVMPLEEYPQGMLVLHEENLTLGRKYGLESRFLYAIHPRTTRHLAGIYKKTRNLSESDLVLGDNVHVRLTGSDTIGVYLDYPERRIYYMNTLANSAVMGTNATCAQVAVGINAALYALIYSRLKPRIYFVGDLYRTFFRHVLFGNMRVEQFVFEKHRGRLVLDRHVPDLRVNSSPKLEPFVV